MKYAEYMKNLKDFDYAIMHCESALNDLHNAGYDFEHDIPSHDTYIPNMASAMIKAQICAMEVVLEEVKNAKDYYEEHIRELVEDFPEE